jgi:hypothetical protein
MGQHPDPNDYEDEEGLEALGTPVYQGSGLSVRALTAEELQRFLDAQGQPAQLLGSGWTALDPPDPVLGAAQTPAVPRPQRSRPQRGSPSRSAAATAALAAPPWSSIGAAVPRNWPPGPAA